MMKLLQLEENPVKGLSVRTSNEKEMQTDTAQIGQLWQTFYDRIVPSMPKDTVPVGVYYNYESDENGEYSLLAGSKGLDDSSELESLTIEAGDYLCFEGKGEMPEVVFNTWKEIWAYFSEGNCPYERAFNTDFEFYASETTVEIYIGVKVK